MPKSSRTSRILRPIFISASIPPAHGVVLNYSTRTVEAARPIWYCRETAKTEESAKPFCRSGRGLCDEGGDPWASIIPLAALFTLQASIRDERKERLRMTLSFTATGATKYVCGPYTGQLVKIEKKYKIIENEGGEREDRPYLR